jgi:hypothetical protein
MSNYKTDQPQVGAWAIFGRCMSNSWSFFRSRVDQLGTHEQQCIVHFFQCRYEILLFETFIFDRRKFNCKNPNYWNNYYTTQHYFFRELNSTFFIDFQFLITAPYLVFSHGTAARQDSEIILNESSKSTENSLIEWLQKDTATYFLKSKVYVVSLILSLVSKTSFGIFLAHLVRLKSEK